MIGSRDFEVIGVEASDMVTITGEGWPIVHQWTVTLHRSGREFDMPWPLDEVTPQVGMRVRLHLSVGDFQ